MFGKPKKSQIEMLREKLSDLAATRQQIILQSTAYRLEQLDIQEKTLRDALFDAQRAEIAAKSASPQTQEERDLWTQIRDLMDREADVLRSAGIISEKFIRPDAVAHFEGELKAKRQSLDGQVSKLRSHQSIPSRLRDQENQLAEQERAFPIRTRPLCIAGEKLFALRAKRTELSARRDALRADREAQAVAAL